MFRLKILNNIANACAKLQCPVKRIEHFQKNVTPARFATEQLNSMFNNYNTTIARNNKMKITKRTQNENMKLLCNDYSQLARNIDVELLPKHAAAAAAAESCVVTPASRKTLRRKQKSKFVNLDNCFELYNLDDGPKEFTKLSKDKAKKYYRHMCVIRAMENATDCLYKERKISRSYHLYTGQEACAVGIKAAMRDNDKIITASRCHAWAYLMGIPPLHILTELLARPSLIANAINKDIMHLYAKNFYGGSGVIGSHLPIGAGVDLNTNKPSSDGGVCLVVYGDGDRQSSNIFDLYNMAYLWNVPCVFVCENNGFTKISNSGKEKCSKIFSYNHGDKIPGVWIDATNILAVKSATKFAIKYARKLGPIILELRTHRYQGIAEADFPYKMSRYQEVESFKDPLLHFANICTKHKLLTELELKMIAVREQQNIDESMERAKTERDLEVKELISSVYANSYQRKIKYKAY